MRSVFKDGLHHAICLQGGTSLCDLSSRRDFIMRPVFKKRRHHAICLPGATSSCDHLSPRSDLIMRPPVFKKRHHHATCLQGATSLCDLSSRSDSIHCDLCPASKPKPTSQDLPPSPGWSFCRFYLVIIIICSCCEALFIHIVFLCTFYTSLF